MSKPAPCSPTDRPADPDLCWHNDVPEPVIGLPEERADAMLPSDLLQGGELILLLLKPSAWYILLGSLGSLATIAVVTAVLLAADRLLHFGSFEPANLLSLALTLAGARLIWQFLEWLSRTYVLTDRRIIRVRGVLHVEVFQAPLHRIQHTELLFSIRERVFALGTIAFATAGSGHPEAYWIMLRHPIAVHKKVLDAINRYGGHMRQRG